MEAATRLKNLAAPQKIFLGFHNLDSGPYYAFNLCIWLVGPTCVSDPCKRPTCASNFVALCIQLVPLSLASSFIALCIWLVEIHSKLFIITTIYKNRISGRHAPKNLGAPQKIFLGFYNLYSGPYCAFNLCIWLVGPTCVSDF